MQFVTNLAGAGEGILEANLVRGLEELALNVEPGRKQHEAAVLDLHCEAACRTNDTELLVARKTTFWSIRTSRHVEICCKASISRLQRKLKNYLYQKL